MDKIEKLGWPYNLYSAITGQSVPDAEYMKTRIYRYKYQRGYYCFFMINPIDASKYISKYLINYINRPYYTIYHASNEYRTSLKYYYEQLHDIFMYMVLLHKYAYGRSYKEIINIFYKDVDTFESCLSDASFFDTPGIRLKIREQHSSLNVRNLYKYELEFLRSLRHDKNFNDIFRSDAIWSLRGFGRPIITEIFTNQDKYKLLCSGPTYGRESVFSINYRLFYNSGLLFKTKISDIFDNVRIIEALSNYNITTIGTLVYYFNSTIAKQMYTNDVIALLKFLKRNGFIASNDFYRSCIDNSITESVCKKKFSKRVIHEVRFVETKRPEKHASIRKTPAEIELHKILESKGDKITRKRRQLERDRYYRNLLMERGYTDTLDSDRIDYRKNKTPEYIISFNKNTTLNDVQEYFSSPPEYIGQEYMSSIGIYCDLEHYDQ